MNSVEKGKKKKHSRSTSTPTHSHTIVPTSSLTSLPTHAHTHNKNILQDIDPTPIPVPPMNNSMSDVDPVDPVPVPPMNNSMSDVDPTPVPVPPMNMSTWTNAYFDPNGPVPVPLNQTYLSLASSSIQVNESSTKTLLYTPLVLISAFVGIGFIAYKRYQKRFRYTQIPDEDSFEI
jgi:hypothetical protein